MAEHNKLLADAAKEAGVIKPFEYAIFQNHGYMGLYDGLGAKEIHSKKGLKKSENILDHMGSTELAANLFRATQTDEKLKRDKIKGKANANKTHFEVGKKVRQTIKELGGEMPEDMSVANSIKKVEGAKVKKEIPQKTTKKKDENK
jgi:DNA-damage-inducible protein D